ncbi:MAG: DUF72 domain-containing protein [Planctomycetes bacterium]|nr:DUF72 domain-containing protein [Planctomycetota bacterium]
METGKKKKGEIRLGTSSWTAEGWEKAFYPPGTKDGDRIACYATRFDTVEIDMTYYRVPSTRMVESWREKTPPGFLFAAKAPQAATSDFTYEKGKRKANPDFLDPETMASFVSTLLALGDRLGPILVQLPYLAKGAFPGLPAFLERLEPFLDGLPPGPRYDVEIRNPSWFKPPLLEALRKRNVGLALTDLTLTRSGGGEYGPPTGPRLFEEIGESLVTSDHVYVRWLGNRKRIEEKTETFDRVIESRDEDLGPWAVLLRRLADLGTDVFAYANNHYEGYAPETVRKIRGLLGIPEPG